MSCKQPKTDNYWLNKSMSIFSFDELTKILSDINNNEKVETHTVVLPIARKIAIGDYEIKIINNAS
jgi:hypothetical protein